MQMLALYSIKGGVGKTAVNLAARAARRQASVAVGYRPPGATTFYLRSKPKVRGGVDKLVKGKADLDRAIRETDIEGLDLLPAALGSAPTWKRRWKPASLVDCALKPVMASYDLAILTARRACLGTRRADLLQRRCPAGAGGADYPIVAHPRATGRSS